jgi:hypothetical protein
VLVQLLQTLKLSHLFKRQAAEAVGIHGSIEPIGRLGAGEIEIAISFFKVGAGASLRKLFIDGLYRNPRVRSA